MALVAAGFACFDVVAYCYGSDACWLLATIGLLNFLYGITAIITCLAYFSVMTMMGMIYFAVEAAIVIPLAIFELAVANAQQVRRSL